MKIIIKDLANKIMLLQVIWILFGELAYSYYPKFRVLSCVPDVLNIILVIFISRKIKYILKSEYIWLLLFVLYVGISSLWGDMNLHYVISYGRRYISAFIIYFVASEYMTSEYWLKGVNILLVAQAINAMATIYQNLVLKLHPDFCNGIFGFIYYNNAIQGIFCLIISVIAMVYFLDRKWSVLKTIYAIGSSCLVCAFAEIKAYFVLIVISFFVALLFRYRNPETMKKILNFMIIAMVWLFIAYKVLEIIFPANLYTFFNLSRYILYEQYGAHGGAGRLTSISYIYDNVFQHNLLKTLFGNGLGSVANDYAYTIGKLFVSFGTVGLFLLLIFILYICMTCCNKRKVNSEKLLSIIIAIMVLVTIFVWNALFTEVVFLVFWVLSVHKTEQNDIRMSLKINSKKKKLV